MGCCVDVKKVYERVECRVLRFSKGWGEKKKFQRGGAYIFHL